MRAASRRRASPAVAGVSDGDEDVLTRRERTARLLERCGDGDEGALEALYASTAPRLLGVALRIVRQEALAEEVLQEAFLKIWRHAPSYSRELGAPLTWLTSIVRHEALDTLRRRRVREDNESPQSERFAELTPDPRAPVDVATADAEILRTCLGRLEPAVRDCIVRAYCEGYSHDELSTAHAAPLGTVKSWIRRGLVKLRSCFDELS